MEGIVYKVSPQYTLHNCSSYHNETNMEGILSQSEATIRPTTNCSSYHNETNMEGILLQSEPAIHPTTNCRSSPADEE